jgi:hypothetical protein
VEAGGGSWRGGGEEKEERSVRPRGDGDGTDVCRRGVVFARCCASVVADERDGERETDLTLLKENATRK